MKKQINSNHNMILNLKYKFKLESINKTLFKRIILLFLFFSLSYSTSYGLFRHFDLTDTRGISDARSYIKMSRGDYNVIPAHKFRFLIPKAVSLLRPFAYKIYSPTIASDYELKVDLIDKYLFLLVNLTLTTLTAYFLFLYQNLIGLNELGSFLGSLLFITSRSTVSNTGSPLIDAGQNFAIIILFYFMQYRDSLRLSFILPFIVLTKETILPIAFLPLFNTIFRKPAYIASLVFSIAILIISRHYIYINTPEQINLLDNILNHMRFAFYNLTDLSLKRAHNLIFSSFGMFTFAAIIGYFINLKEKIIIVPKESYLLLLYTIILSFLIKAPGRILFMSFPLIIPFAVIFIFSMLNQSFTYLQTNIVEK